MARYSEASVEACVKEIRRIAEGKRYIPCTELVNELIARGFDTSVVLRAIVEAEERGLIRLVEKPPASLREVLTSPLALDFWFVLVIVTSTLILAVFLKATQPPLVYVRYVVGSLFVLFVPGFSLVQCLYPLREELTDLERLALSLGLSLAIVPLVGLILNYTPFGIRLTPVVVSLSGLSLGLITGALVRRVKYLRRTAPQ